MAGRKLEYQIGVDPSSGIAGLKQFSSAAKKAMKSVDDSMDDTTTSAQKVAKALSGLADELETEMKGAAKAAGALSDALGPELAGRANVDSVVADLHKMGLTFDEITADADTLAVSLKKLDGVQMQGAAGGLRDVEQSTKRAKDGVDEVGRSADSSKGALANMVGNSVQDLGSLGGVAGSAGVAIGQMGEYIADAALEGEALSKVIGSFAKVAGPIAALTAVFQTIQGIQNSAAESSERTKKNVEAWVKALEDGGDPAANMTKELAEQGEIILDNARNFDSATKILSNIPVVGWFGDKDKEDVTALFEAATIGVEDYTRAVVQQGAAEASVRQAIEDSNLSDKEKQQLLTKLGDDIDDYTQAVETRNRKEKVFGIILEATTDSINKFIKAHKPIEDMPKTWQAVTNGAARMRAGLQPTTNQLKAATIVAEQYGITAEEAFNRASDAEEAAVEAWQQGIKDTSAALDQWAEDSIQAVEDWAISLDDARAAVDELAGSLSQTGAAHDALASVFDVGNEPVDLLGRVADIHDAMRDLFDFINDPKGLKGKIPDIFDPNDINAGAFIQKIESLRGAIQGEIENVFSDPQGGEAAALATADNYVNQLFVALKGKISKDKIRELLGISDLQVKLHVAVDEKDKANAEKELAILTGLAGNDPWTASIALALQEGTISPQTAKVLIERELKKANVEIPNKLATPDTGAAKAAADRFGADPHNAVELNSKLGNADPSSKVNAHNDAQNYATRNPIVWPSTLAAPRNAAQILRDPFAGLFGRHDAGGTVSGPGGWVAERRPEIVNSRYLVTSPTLMPPGTRVTSGARTARVLRTRGARGLRRYDSGGTIAGPSTVNLNIHTAVIGNRFEVDRQIRKSMQQILRLYGSRN